MKDRLEIEQGGDAETGVCDCCGHKSCSVWGFVWQGEATVAAYVVHWTMGHVPEHGANFDLILTGWGDNTNASDRWAVSLSYRLLDSGPGFMVIDADTRDFAKDEIVTRALKREDVVGQPFSERIFAVCDAVLTQDDRLEELVGGWEASA